MSDKPLTEKTLVKILDQKFLQSEKRLIETIDQKFVDFWEQVLEPNLVTKVEFHEKTNELESKIDKNTNQIKQLQRDVTDIKADLSDTPSRKEFEALKSKMGLSHPVA